MEAIPEPITNSTIVLITILVLSGPAHQICRGLIFRSL